MFKLKLKKPKKRTWQEILKQVQAIEIPKHLNVTDTELQFVFRKDISEEDKKTILALQDKAWWKFWSK